jgi:hypothetical protein
VPAFPFLSFPFILSTPNARPMQEQDTRNKKKREENRESGRIENETT